MKKLMNSIISLALLLCLLCPRTVFASSGSSNVDGGGGGMGSGTTTNTWSSGNEGVRVTVVRANDHAIVSQPFDFSSKVPTKNMFHFGKVSKMQYNNGAVLSSIKGGYVSVKPAKALPKIISTNGSNNIAAIKKYFCSKQGGKKQSQLECMASMVAGTLGLDIRLGLLRP